MIHDLLDKLCDADETALREEANKLRRRLSLLEAILGDKRGPGGRRVQTDDTAPRLANTPKTAATAGDLPERIAKYLKFAGPKRSDAIAREMGVSGLEAVQTMEARDLFERDGPCWKLSPKGHTHLAG